MAKQKGYVCTLMKSKRAIKCYNKKGDLVGIYTPRKKRR